VKFWEEIQDKITGSFGTNDFIVPLFVKKFAFSKI